MQNLQLIHEDKIEIINRSMEGISRDVSYVSPKKRYLVYNYATKHTLLKEIKRILDENPDYLVNEEKRFLELFYKAFIQSKTHNGYLLSPDNYFRLLDSGIQSVTSRIIRERKRIVEGEDDVEIQTKIQYILYQLSEVLKVIRTELDENLLKFSKNPYLVLSFAKNLHQAVLYVIDTYIFEFQYFRKEEIFGNDIDVLLEDTNRFYLNFFSEHRELVVSVLGEKNAVLI